jgi:hypothetical protein
MWPEVLKLICATSYTPTMSEEIRNEPAQINIAQDAAGGVWANFAMVSHSPYEFTIDFIRMDFARQPLAGVVVSRVNLSPLFVTQLLEALKENWEIYASKAMPPEVQNDNGH